MKFSLAWLRDHLEGTASADELAAKLTAAGMNVELRERIGDDEVWDVDVTANRPDAMNHRGLAREAAAAGCGTLKPLASGVVEGATRSATSRRSRSRTPPGARATAPASCAASRSRRRRRGSPRRLERCGVRPVNNVVDATNYVLLDVGQPLHAFDLALLAGHEIRVRRARAGEAITTLDGVERKLTADDLVIADAARAVAVAGVMGAANSEISARHERTS